MHSDRFAFRKERVAKGFAQDFPEECIEFVVFDGSAVVSNHLRKRSSSLADQRGSFWQHHTLVMTDRGLFREFDFSTGKKASRG